MSNSISSAPPVQPAAEANASRPVAKPSNASQQSTQARPQQAAEPKDTVQISAAAQAAIKEAAETPSQTAKEAASGDQQAQRLLAKEATAQKGR